MNTIKEDIFEEAVNALRTLDESGLKSVIGYIKRLVQRHDRNVIKKHDPFYSPQNITRLQKAVNDVKEGKAKFVYHDIIEVDDD